VLVAATVGERVDLRAQQSVGSAREAERMMDYDPGLQWLAGGQQINYQPLADFGWVRRRAWTGDGAGAGGTGQ